MSIFVTGLAAAMALLASEPAATGNEVNPSAADGASKPLLICERDDASKRAMQRQYGKAVYVTAQEVIDARGDGQRWDAPRCITPAEFSRLRKMVGGPLAVATR
jgi:hypothetical protein